MTTRDQIVRTALGFNGRCNGQGYNHENPFSADRFGSWPIRHVECS